MLETLLILIAVLGSLFLFILLAQANSLNNDNKLKKHQFKDTGLADLLNYAAVVDEGVIVCKNGSFMAGWLYKAADNASSTPEQQTIISKRLNQALSTLGNGWMIHVDAVRRPATKYSSRNESFFGDDVCEAIDEERRRLFESLGTMYEGYFVITLTWFPPLLAQKKFVELMFDDDNKSKNKKEQTVALIEQFKNEIKTTENKLSTAVDLIRLKGYKLTQEDGSTTTNDDFLRWLQFCITGITQPIQLPNNPMYLDSYLGGKELWGGVIPKIGRKFIQTVAIEGFPLESSPGILNALSEVPVEYRWSSRFIFMDRHEAINHLDKFRNKWKQKIRGFFDQVFNTNSGNIDQDALSMTRDAEAAIAEVNSGLVAMGYYTSNIVLMDENRDRLEEAARVIEKKITQLGFVSRIETINNLDAFFGSLPGHGVENVRRPLINTLNLADLMPTSSIWTGLEKAPCPMYPPNSPCLMHGVTSGATPFRLNLHVRDLGHTFMFGPTGSGKSTHLALLAAQFRRYKGMTIYSFDKGLSMYPITKASNGLHFTVGSDDDKLAFCPLQYLDTKSDRAWALEWIDTILNLNGVITTPLQRNEIDHALNSMNNSDAKTMSEFVMTVQDDDIRNALKQYTIDGSFGHLLDAAEDGLSMSDFTTFEIEELLNLGDKFALPVLLYLFRRIEADLKGQPAVIFLDEAWIMLGHETFREKIKEWLKVLRKANCIVVMATQSLSDASNSGILDVIVESTATKIYLPNLYAKDEDTAALYKRMGLNQKQINILANAIPKRQYYYSSENGRRLYDLALGPLALSFVGASDKESLAVIKQLEQKHGDEWVAHWLASRNINLKDYLEAA